MPEIFTVVRGAAAPLLRANIDTDTISPGSRPAAKATAAQFSEKGSSTLAADLFAGWRYDEAGDENPGFVLNRPEFRAAKILLTGPNFGCGSSRESAVWMLKEWGIRCIIAPSFGEIFYGSCFKNALLPLVMSDAAVRQLADEAAPGEPDAMFEVDLAGGVMRTPSGAQIAIELPKIRRDALLEGIDEIDLTLKRGDAIAAFERTSVASAPWLYRLPHGVPAPVHPHPNP